MGALTMRQLQLFRPAVESLETREVPAVTWPAHYFAPYVDMSLTGHFNFAKIAKNQGAKFFTAAFIVADNANKPSWGGYTAYDIGSANDAQIKTDLTALRNLGGDVMISFGGAAGTELALVDKTVSSLQTAYQSVIDTYSVTHLDFDIEGKTITDHASIDRRSQAIAGLQATAAAAGQSLQVWFTLPVEPSGLDNNGLYVVQSAQKYGVTFAGVNIMTMDFGDANAPNPKGKMGTYAIDAANSTFQQLGTLYTSATTAQLWAMIGVTPMIGVNDQVDEVFRIADANQLLTFAKQKGLGELAMWSLQRDHPGTSSDTASGLTAASFSFTNIFKAFTS
jgi:Glycosyl hydrolases family 18